MRHPLMKLVTLVLLLSASTARPATSAPWVLRGHILESDYEHTAADANVSGVAFDDLSAKSGFQAALEYRRSPRLGWEFSAGQFELDATARFSRVVAISFDPLVLQEQVTVSHLGTMALRPVTAGPLFHVPAGRLVDVYLGPFLGVTLFEVDANMNERDPELTYGGKLGAEVRFGRSNWALGIELRHLQVDHETLDRDLYRDIELQTVGVGISYHLPD